MPTIRIQPVSQTVLAGENVSFTVVASGDAPLTYRWQRNGVDLQAGALGASYSLDAVQFSDNDSIWTVRVSNTAGMVISEDAKLTVKPAQNGNISLLVNDLEVDTTYFAMDGTGNIYGFVNDLSTQNRTRSVQKITPEGIRTTLATGLSYDYGQGGIAVDAEGNVYVAENLNGITSRPGGDLSYAGIVRKISPVGIMTTLAGSATNYNDVDGIGAAAGFNTLTSMTIDASGNLYVGQYSGGHIRKITPEGVVTTFATGFNRISALTVDRVGNIYVASVQQVGGYTYPLLGYAGLISKVSPAGIVTNVAGNLAATGSNDGPGTGAHFGSLTGIAVDGAGNVYVSDHVYGDYFHGNSIRKISIEGKVLTITAAQSSPQIILGPLPGNLPLIGWLVFDAQGILFVRAGVSLFKIQFSS